jgi:hypothetical protein
MFLDAGSYRCIQGSLYCERADKYPFIKNIMLGKEEIVSPSLDELKEHYHRILTLLGEDAGREGLQKTPERVAKAMLSLTKGYHMDPHEVLRSAKFQGRTQSLMEWSRELDIPRCTLRYRIRKGWTADRILSQQE